MLEAIGVDAHQLARCLVARVGGVELEAHRLAQPKRQRARACDAARRP
jgi:hypothetical protein